MNLPSAYSVWYTRGHHSFTSEYMYVLYRYQGTNVPYCSCTLSYMWTSQREDKFSSFFLGCLPISSWTLQFSSWNLNPLQFSWILHVHVPNVQFAPCAIRETQQFEYILMMTSVVYESSVYQVYTVQKLSILPSRFVLITLYTHPELIISHLVGHYLNIC